MKHLIVILFGVLPLNVLSQNESNIWYFGQNAGIDFNSGSPVTLTDGALVTDEGCASICDNSGNLLFYTDGSTVYNRNHVVMPNGTGLAGDVTSTQSAIIVKKPASDSIYYIFTVDGQGGMNGFRYSKVDMSLQGGLGDVNSAVNVPVYAPTCEKLTAVQHSNGVDFWIIIHSYPGNEFRSYLLNSAGLSNIPTISNVGTNVITAPGGPNVIGYLKVNPAGNKIASAVTHMGVVDVFDFDNATGILSYHFSITAITPYGIEFSPNSQYLYMSEWGFNLKQFDLNAGSVSDILSSEVILFSNTLPVFGALQLAPDQRIYVAEVFSNTLSVIACPDLPGISSNFMLSTITLPNGTFSNQGLPAALTSAFAVNIHKSTLCSGDSLTLSDESFDNFNWALANNPGIIISNDSSITVSPTVSTDYVLFDGTDSAFFKVSVQVSPVVDLGPDFSICPGSTTHTLTNLNPSAVNSTYLWQNGSTNHSLTLNTTGDYWLQVTDPVGCTGSDTVKVTNLTGIEFTVGNPACHDESNGSIVVNTTGSPANITFVIKDSLGNVLNTSGSNIAINLSAGYYFVDYSDGSCTATDSIVLDNPPPITFDVVITNPLCFGDSTGTAHEINLAGYQGELDSVYYSWVPDPLVINNGLGVDSIWGLQAREYSLEIVDHFGCTGSVDFEIVNPPQLRAIFSEPVLPFCRTSGLQTGAGIVSASADPDASGTGSTTFLWEHLDNGQTSNVPTFVVRGPGTVQLTLTDANGCEFTDQIYLDSISPKADFDIESDQFDLPDIYEGTEDVRIRITNLSSGFAREDDPNDDIVFQWNLYTNEYPDGDKNWFFTHSLDDRVDTVYKGEEVYQVCLAIQNFNDCADTACKEVTVHVRPEMITPNVFTPGAPPNETFFFPNLGINEFECTVFNRYGVVVYEFDDISDQWDGNHYLSGKPCADAVYFYTYKAMSTNGTPFEGSGNITLLRNQ